MSESKMVYIVDDDAAMTESLRWLVESDGLNVQTFNDAEVFLKSYTPSSSDCLLLDIRMPKLSGLEVQERLKKQRQCIPIIFITGHGDVPMAIRAMKAGAVDFLTKPFDDKALLESIKKAIEISELRQSQQRIYTDIAQRINSLTPREREIMSYVTNGWPNKNISSELGIGCKTVEIHRSQIMKKMQAKSLANLVRTTINYESLEKLLYSHPK